MSGRLLGAMPVCAFLHKYVPATEEPLSALRAKPFDGVPSDGESARYDPFVSTRLISKDQFRDNVRHPDRRDRSMDASPSGCKHKLQGTHDE